MVAISKIVVGTDFSEISERALELALDLAERVLRVADCPVLTVPRG